MMNPEAEPGRRAGVSLPTGVRIRPARPRDATSFVALLAGVIAEGRYLRSEYVRHPPRVYRLRFRHAWTSSEAQIVAVSGRRVIGHVHAQREADPVLSHVATLGISVASDQRRRGIGTALMAEVFRWADEVGVEKLFLSVYPHNKAAIALYGKFGFVEEGRLSGHSKKASGYEDEVLMAAWIRRDA